jgi:protein SCO1/2
MKTFALLVAGALVLTACSPTPEPRAEQAAEAVVFRGGVLEAARPRPAFTLRTTDGAPFEFARETAGTLTMLFFGYTNCPDVCPVHMANLAQVRKDLAPSVNQQLRIVFVTTDPARDTPEVLGKWLEQIGGSIIGLTGTEEEIRRAQEAANVPPAYKEGEGEDYGVGHMAWVIAITPDDRVRLMYPFGTRQEDWAHDIPLLLAQYPAR